MNNINSNGMPNIPYDKAEEVCCDECGNKTFNESFLFKKISKFYSPTGNDILIPSPVYKCDKCGHINKIFLED